ncbi:MAG TPA: RNA methyltransferase [Polyangiaceae bacterium]
MTRTVALALLHHPVVDRQGEVVTSAITNLDLHDIARSAFTYGLDRFYAVHPIEAQRELALCIKSHWVEGSGARRIPDRQRALSRLEVVDSLDRAIAELEPPVELWATSAAAGPGRLGYAEARARARQGQGTVLLVFGTGWGLAPSVIDRSNQVLEPIRSPRSDGYNHLSVRAAAAIILDRLFGHEG